MSELVKYRLTFPQTKIRLNQNTLTFSIQHIKSRKPSVVYFKFMGYDVHNTLITEYTSNRWVILTEYQKRFKTFNLEFGDVPTNPDRPWEEVDSYVIEMYLIGVDSENPLYFNRLQLSEGEDKDEYHIPNEEKQEVTIGFNNNSYVNLYDTTDTYLQIIRPKHEDFTTKTLIHSEYTVIAPHLANESEFDNAVALLYEYMYQTEQIIGVEK